MFAKSISSFRPRAQRGETGNYGETMKKERGRGGIKVIWIFCFVLFPDSTVAFPRGPAPHVEHDPQRLL